MSVDNKSLSHFELTGIPPAPRGVPRIEVAFDLDADGLLTVSAKDLGTGREQRVTVMPTTGLSEHDIERLVAEAESMADEDVQRRALADARNKAEGLLYSAERALAEFGHMLDEDQRATLQQDLADCRTAIEGGVVGEVEEAVARLEVSAHQIGEAIYAAASTAGEGEGEVGPGGEGEAVE
jgi:molecular chaperone DnaK